MKALDLQGLSKNYTVKIKKPGLWGAVKGLWNAESKLVEAVKGLSLGVNVGEAVGLIGENGAGKSTTMKLCTGILKPSSGSLKVLGYTPSKERRKLALHMGVVFGQRPQLIWDIAVRETFALNRVMYKIPDAVYAETLALTTRLLELDSILDQPVRQLSLGQRMRADLACAFLHAPKVVFLDEPTIGLDVLAKEQARHLIKEMRRRFNTTMILTTHDLKDITDTCKRVVLLDKGSLLFDGSLAAFEAKYAREKRIVVDLEKILPAKGRVKLEKDLKRMGARLSNAEGSKLTVAYEKQNATRPLTQFLLKRLKIADLAFEKTEIEAVVRRIYSKQKTDA